MRVLSVSIALGLSCLVLALVGCTSVAVARSPADACVDAVEGDLDPASCDHYVAAARDAGDKKELFAAYSYRSLLWQTKGDLVAAIRDADLAIEARPEVRYGHYWRAVLVGESGEYQAALTKLRSLESEERYPEFHADIAMLEYMGGDRASAASFFRSASTYASEVDRDEDSAAYYAFNAAIIESELKGGDLAPIQALKAAERSPTVLSRVWTYRVGRMTDAKLQSLIPTMTGPRTRNSPCMCYFAIGHKNALAGNTAEAKAAFEAAASNCTVDSFEHHAAKKWLKS